MKQAVADFGNNGDGVFNGAGFSIMFGKLAGVKDALDGRWVNAILRGRSDVEVLSGGSHYRLLDP